MSKIDHLSLDGHALSLLVAVAEEGSVTRAAERLDLTQSGVSHALDRLRAITGDALFVRSGRGIVATPQAEVLVQRARMLLDELLAFSQASGFDPARLSGPFTVAANDLQRDLLLPPLLRRLRPQAPGLTLRVVPSGAPQAALLRDGACDLLITPRPPEGSDIVHRRLFVDRYVVFFDAACRSAPRDRADWLQAEHVTVRYEDGRGLDIDDHLAAQGPARRFVATVPGFAGIAAMLQGSPWLASSPAPVQTPVMPMFAVWHRRRHEDPSHRWVREALLAVVAEAGLVSPGPLAAGADSGFGIEGADVGADPED